MSDVVDARGYVCPQPLMMLVRKMKEGNSEAFSILVDNETSRENIRRTAEGRSWSVVEDIGIEDYFRISIRKGA